MLSEANCVSAWHKAAGERVQIAFTEATRASEPVNATGIITNFQQADTDGDGKVSRAEFIQACKLGLVTARTRMST